MPNLPYTTDKATVVNQEAKAFAVSCLLVNAHADSKRLAEVYDEIAKGYGITCLKEYGLRVHPMLECFSSAELRVYMLSRLEVAEHRIQLLEQALVIHEGRMKEHKKRYGYKKPTLKGPP